MKKLASVLFVLLLIVCARLNAGIICYFPSTFPNLIEKTPVIAKGTIEITNNKYFLVVDHLLKGKASERIHIGDEPKKIAPSKKLEKYKDVKLAGTFGHFPLANLYDGNKVILFLFDLNKEGTEARIGIDDKCKWPKNGVNSIKRKYDTDDLDRIEKVINAFLDAFEKDKTIDEKVKRIINMVNSNDDMIKLAGLDLSHDSTYYYMPIWESNSYHITRQLAAYTIDLYKSKNPDVRELAAENIRHTPSIVAAPILIELVADQDAAVSRSAGGMIKQVFSGFNRRAPLALSSPTRLFPVKLPTLDTQEGRNKASELCKSVWDSVKEQQTEIILPKIKKSLESSSELERESAKIYFKYLNIPIEPGS